MHVKRENLSTTKARLTITASSAELGTAKESIVRTLGSNVRIQGFRPGKAPLHLLEKQLDPSVLQTEFLEQIVNELYVAAVRQVALRTTKQPEISITKFVPFTTLEFSAETEIVGELKLPDYKKIKLAFPKVEVTAKDVNEVLDSLRNRAAEKEIVERAAKTGDEVEIDFTGVDAKTKEAIDGAEGKNYSLQLGSQTFIPGFEEQLIGLKADAEKTFRLTFPKDYGVIALQNRKISFTVKLQHVKKIILPKLDNNFALKVGPFPSLSSLKADIKKQLEAEKKQKAQNDYHNLLLEKITSQATMAIPDSLIEGEIDRIEEEEKQNLLYRGQTWQEHLDAEGLSAEAHRTRNRPAAELRVKAGILLTEVSEQEKISVSPEEIAAQVEQLKQRYKDDPGMLAELDKPQGKREIGSRLLSDKTIAKLAFYASK